MAIKTATELAAACKNVASNYKTLYVLGCIGAPLNDRNKARFTNNLDFNRNAYRAVKINAATPDTFGFDCVCLIKSLLWGWNGDTSAVYGGASYASNGVPDIGADAMFAQCMEQSSDFSSIQIGEALWFSGHIGVYVGDGLAVECTHRWKDGVQFTAVHNIGEKTGYDGRSWTKHGKLPYVEYTAESPVEPTQPTVESIPAISLPTLREGDEGDLVKVMQLLLIKNNCSCGSRGADGKFGVATKNAVMMYQDQHRLTVDGICGGITWASLLFV